MTGSIDALGDDARESNGASSVTSPRRFLRAPCPGLAGNRGRARAVSSHRRSFIQRLSAARIFPTRTSTVYDLLRRPRDSDPVFVIHAEQNFPTRRRANCPFRWTSIHTWGDTRLNHASSRWIAGSTLDGKTSVRSEGDGHLDCRVLFRLVGGMRKVLPSLNLIQ